MNRILKFEMPVLEKFELQLPRDAQIIRVEDVEGRFYLWAVCPCTPEGVPLSTEARRFEAYKTGMPIHTHMGRLQYVGFVKLFIMQELGLYIFENVNA